MPNIRYVMIWSTLAYELYLLRLILQWFFIPLAVYLRSSIAYRGKTSQHLLWCHCFCFSMSVCFWGGRVLPFFGIPVYALILLLCFIPGYRFLTDYNFFTVYGDMTHKMFRLMFLYQRFMNFFRKPAFCKLCNYTGKTLIHSVSGSTSPTCIFFVTACRF